LKQSFCIPYCNKVSGNFLGFGNVTNFASDYDGKRQGNRVVSIGEKPYFDPNSVSRREALFGPT
jgi:hypothetical protein